MSEEGRERDEEATANPGSGSSSGGSSSSDEAGRQCEWRDSRLSD